MRATSSRGQERRRRAGAGEFDDWPEAEPIERSTPTIVIYRRTDSWSHTTDHVLIAISYAAYRSRDIWVDYHGDRLLLGGDETGQFVTDLRPSDPDVTVVDSGTPEEMAAAADWVEAQLRKRRVWVPGLGWRER